MRPATLIATLALAAALSGTAAAVPSACPEHYPGGLAPDILRPALAERARELCFRSYAVLHSGVSRTALAAAEHLTRERVQAARGLERENVFHEEERLPPEERAHLGSSCYSGPASSATSWIRATTPRTVPTSGRILAAMSAGLVGAEEYNRAWANCAAETMW